MRKISQRFLSVGGYSCHTRILHHFQALFHVHCVWSPNSVLLPSGSKPFSSGNAFSENKDTPKRAGVSPGWVSSILSSSRTLCRFISAPFFRDAASEILRLSQSMRSKILCPSTVYAVVSLQSPHTIFGGVRLVSCPMLRHGSA